MWKRISSCALILALSLCLIIGTPMGTKADTADSLSNVPTSGTQSPYPHEGIGTGNKSSGMSPMVSASGYISTVQLDIYDNGNGTVSVNAITNCFSEMNKVGVQNMSIQRWDNGQWNNVYTWSNYVTNDYIYDDWRVYNVAVGYNYRLVATHYAEKDILFVPFIQTISNTTGYIYVCYS